MRRLLNIWIFIGLAEISYCQDSSIIHNQEVEIIDSIVNSITFRQDCSKSINIFKKEKIRNVLPPCIGEVFLKTDPLDSFFFAIIEDSILFRKTNCQYQIYYNTKNYILPIEITIIQHGKIKDLKILSELIMKCYCLPDNYPIGFYSFDGFLIIFQPYMIKMKEIKKREELYEFLRKYLSAKLSTKYIVIPQSLREK
ncbi:MAG: hypothetical protein ACKVQB_08530 [Bacteroidia bacterium]